MVDNLRYDQWKVVEPWVFTKILQQGFQKTIVSLFCHLQLHNTPEIHFSGLMPSGNRKTFQTSGFNDNEESNKNELTNL